MDKTLDTIRLMLEGSGITLEIFCVTLALSLPLGLFVALGRLSHFRPLSRILELIDSRNCQPQAMREVLQLPLPPSWQHMFQRRLDTGECEDWQRRLFG